MWRVVVDPGVLVAALISKKGAPAQILLGWRAGLFELVVSPLLLRELGRVLTRDKFRRYVSLDEAEHYVRMILRGATLVEDPPDPPPLTPDPGDDYLLALASAAGARFLVSGDPHLTELTEPVPPVLTPRAFLDRLES
jgi:putative PIN family toxin of toxin-antitoxin system